MLAIVPLAPSAALMLVTFAENKVQGWALVKGTSLAMIAALGAGWVPVPWQWTFGLLPTYWPLQLYGALLAAHPAWWYLLAHYCWMAYCSGCCSIALSGLSIGKQVEWTREAQRLQLLRSDNPLD